MLGNHAARSQAFSNPPDLGGDLDAWYNSLTPENFYPFQEGIFYFVYEMPVTYKEHPFFQNLWEDGDLFYEGREYRDVRMAYNIQEDHLNVWHWVMNINGPSSLLIDQVKVDSFSIYQKTFVNHNYVDVNDEGFFRKIYRGSDIGFYAKHSKEREINSRTRSVEYEEKIDYFVLYQGQKTTLKNNRSVYQLFPSLKKEVKQFMRTNNLYVKKDELSKLKILSFCESRIR